MTFILSTSAASLRELTLKQTLESDLLCPLLWLGGGLLYEKVPPVQLHHRTVLDVTQHLGHWFVCVTLQREHRIGFLK